MPIEIAPAELFSSRTPSASSSIVSSEFRMISPAPVVVTVKWPVPVLTATAVPAVTLPMVIVRAAAPVPRFTAAVSASEARLSAVPAVKIVADASSEANPLAPRVVKEPAAGVVPPIAGGTASSPVNFKGVTILASSVPVLVSACVASSAIPASVSLARGAPATAIRPTV